MLKTLLFLILLAGRQNGLLIPVVPASFSHFSSLQVLVISPQGQPLAGVSLNLCREEGRLRAEPRKNDPARCLVTVSDEHGQAKFQAIPPAEYRLRGELSGYASTELLALSIAGPDPIAPDRVVLLLNPVCWHC